MRILLVVLLIGCLPTFAAAWTLSYVGETNDITSYESGSDSLWDYVYDVTYSISSSQASWAIPANTEPIGTITVTDARWNADWGVINIYNHPQNGQYGVFFDIDADELITGTYRFSFQSSASPMLVSLGTPTVLSQSGYSYPTWKDAQGHDIDTTWSNPEPVSFVLTGLALAGGLWTRRRKAAGAGKARPTRTPVE